ncbi:MAG: cysteine methyltransferase, partial [Sorangium cellulosum]
MHGTQTALRTIYFEDHRRAAPIPEGAKHGHPMLTDVAKQLSAYFAGDPRELDCRIDLIGTEFQKSVWNLLKQIPWGTTWTYGQLAARLGKPRAARAVGHANAMNPVSIVIPC